MDYAEAQAAFFGERTGEARPLGWDTPARRLRDAIEPLATVVYWSEPSYRAHEARGMDFLAGYVWGRTSALGEPEPAVAVAAFGVFEPGLVEQIYVAGREAAPLDVVREARVVGAGDALRQALGGPDGEDVEGLAETVAALRAAVEALPPLGRPIFAGLASLPWPEDPYAALWHACAALREHRGDGHLAALAICGLDGVQANLLTELWVGWDPTTYAGSRGFSPEAMAEATATLESRGLVADGALTDAGRALREEVETLTDRAEEGVVAALGGDLDPIVTRLDGWSASVLEKGWFPPDPYKRASG